MHEEFLDALKKRRKVRLTFYSKEDAGTISRSCAPMDHGPSRRARDKSMRYHFWDFDSDSGSHVLSLSANQIVALQVLDEPFEPGEFITWSTKKSPWFVVRDWGRFS